MDPLVIVLIALALLIGLFFLGGVLGARRREREQAPDLERHIAEADQALEQARAVDRGWDREVMEQAARRALAEAQPGFEAHELRLVLVDDRPGTDEDRARFMAVGPGGELEVVLARTGDHWAAERVG